MRKMKMKKWLMLMVGLLAVGNLNARDFFEEIVVAHEASDLEKVERLLSEWEKESPNDIEMSYTNYNYYLERNATFDVLIGPNGPYQARRLDSNDVLKAVSYLQRAVENQPSRFDLHHTICSKLIDSQNFDEGTNAIINLLNVSKTIENRWKTGETETSEPQTTITETTMFHELGNFCGKIFNKFDQNKANLEKIITLIEELYPNNAIGLNIAARYYTLSGNPQKTISLLTKAIEINPKDYILLYNLGYCYEEEGNYVEAKKCYRRMLRINDSEAKKYAREALAGIKGKV